MNSGTYKEHKWLLGREILIFILDSSKHDIWQCRFKNRLDNKTKYVRKSTKHTELNLAISTAIAKYREHQTRDFLGLKDEKITIGRCVAEFNKSKTSASTSTKRTVNYLNDVYWSKWFRGNDISNINTDTLESYYEWRITKNSTIQRGAGWASSKNTVSASALNIDRINLRKLLRYAEQKRLIVKSPEFPRIQKDELIHELDSNQSRGRFTGRVGESYYKILSADFQSIRKSLRKDNWKPRLNNPEEPFNETSNNWRSQANLTRDINWYRRDRTDFDSIYCSKKRRFHKANYWFLCLLVSNTGCRPQEAARLRHSDVRLIRDEDGVLFTLITISADVSKTGRARQLIARDLHSTYERYLEYRKEIEYRFNRNIKETDWLFPSTSREGEYDTPRTSLEYGALIRERFKKLGTHTADIPVSSTSAVATVKIYFSLYSFRAYFITQRLKHGVDIYTLSLQVGSSIATIQKFYATNIIWDFRKSMVRHIRTEYKNTEINKDLLKYSEQW